MAIKELKSIKFPGLEDTYVVAGKVDVDAELSETSENPVQNKVIKENLDNKSDNIQTKSGSVITANNSAHTPLKGLKIFGKTTQNGTPSPDAPVPLNTVGDNGSITTIINGKNLLNLIDGRESVTGSGVTYTRNDDGSYTRNGTAINEPGNAWLRGGYSVTPNSNNVIIHLLPNTYYYVRDCQIYSYSNRVISMGPGNIYIDPSQYPDGVKITGVRNPVHIVNKEYSNDIIYPAVFLGSSDNINTDYEPYIENTATFSTPNGLPGIPVTSGGNYTDSTGQQWICDEVDFARGKYIKRVGSTKGEQWELTNIGSGTGERYRIHLDVKPIKFIPVLCTHYHFEQRYSYTSAGNYITTDEIRDYALINLRTDVTFGSADAFNTWVNENEMFALYPITTPIETDLTEELLAAYTAMHTNYPNSTIYNDAGADMEVKYYTPNTAVQMVHSPVDEGKVLAIDEHGCVVLSDDVGGGTISIDLEGVNEGEATPINADTLGGYAAEDYVLKEYLNNYGLVEKNYSIVGGPNEPENPTENMIWVNTENEISDHVISRNEPRSPKEGMIWILDNDNSTVSFHKIKVNDIKVEEIYPISAKQYINDTWVKVDAMIYQGAWEPFWDGTLYESGKEYEVITGGWAFSNGRNNSCTSGTWERGATYLRLNTSADPRACQACTVKKIDLTNYKYLCCNSTGSGSLQIGETDQMYNGLARSVGEGTTRKLDITAYTGEYYVAIHKYTFNNDVTMVWGNFTVTKIWLE